MKKLLNFVVAVLFLIGLSCPAVLHAKGGGGHGGGHGGGRSGGGAGFHGGHGGAYHGSGFHGSSGYRGGYRYYGAYRYNGGYRYHGTYSSFGWYGVGFFGAPYPDPRYYYGTPYYDPYSVPLDFSYPESEAALVPETGSEETEGEWVIVPGQTVDGRWIPSHEAWVPKSP
jgi:hypothetical protein